MNCYVSSLWSASCLGQCTWRPERVLSGCCDVYWDDRGVAGLDDCRVIRMVGEYEILESIAVSELLSSI